MHPKIWTFIRGGTWVAVGWVGHDYIHSEGWFARGPSDRVERMVDVAMDERTGKR